MKLSEEKIKDIAEHLDMGLVCFINPQTLETKIMVDPDHPDFMGDVWDADIEEIDTTWERFIKLEPMLPHASFVIMKDFLPQVSHSRTRVQLETALENRKPFRNFKAIIDRNFTLREAWFAHKAKSYQQWVRDQLEELDPEAE